MNDKYTYESIDITTKSGKKYSYNYCDYYIQDNILTVYRKEAFKKINYGNDILYNKLESHFPMENVENIKCIN